MAKLYGDEVRERSGIEQALLQKIPPKLVEEVRPLPSAGASARKSWARPLPSLSAHVSVEQN
mgnify:CR=1 FL=1